MNGTINKVHKNFKLFIVRFYINISFDILSCSLNTSQYVAYEHIQRQLYVYLFL